MSLAIDTHNTTSPFALDELETYFETALRATTQPRLYDLAIKAMAKLAVRGFQQLGNRARNHTHAPTELTALTISFLTDPKSVRHPLIDRKLPVIRALEGYLGMAYGNEPASLDYCLGQVGLVVALRAT